MAGNERAADDADNARQEAGADASLRTIAIGGETADLLQARAAALGISVADLLAMIVGNKPAEPPPAGEDGAAPAATDGAAPAAAGDPAAARWREVKAWIDSWGKPHELPRPKLGK